MIPTQQRTKVIADFNNEKKFVIEASAEAFRIISNNLYSDPVAAIVRELGCNAYDSQVEANNIVPFDIHFPTTDKPQFIIRDYGTGMTKEKVYDVYTSVFTSDKRTTNSQTGCLGLGSKTPFALFDSFSVDSYVDGTLYSWIIYKDNEGIPCATLISESETDEPNGVRITIDIQSKYIYDFQNKVNCLSPFKVQPNSNITIPQYNYLYKTTNYGLVNDNYRMHSMALMGNVLYNINVNAFSNLTNNQRNILNSGGVHFFFDIGELSFSASREELNLDVLTQNKIKEKIQNYIDDFIKLVQLEVDDCNNLIDAYRVYCKYRNRAITIEKCEYKGYSLINPKPISVEYQTVYQSKTNNYTTIDLYNAQQIQKIIINDLSRGAISRMRHNGYCGYRYALMEQEQYDKFLVELKATKSPFEVEYASKLESKKRSSIKSSIPEIGVYNGSYRSYDAWTKSELGDGYYVILYRNQVLWNNKAYSFDQFRRILKMVDVKEKIYGVKKKYQDKIEKTKMRHLFDVVNDILKKEASTVFEYSSKDLSNVFRYNIRYRLPQSIKDVIKENLELYNQRSTANNILQRQKILGVTHELKSVDKYEYYLNKVKKYPLLLDQSITTEQVSEYTQLIDKKIN